MQKFEYVAIPAPRKGVSAKGVKGVPGKFANAVSIALNEMAAEGWTYLRTDTLPCEERQGLTGKTVKYHAMLIFSRPLDIPDDQLALPAPDAMPGSTAEDDTPPEDMLDELVEEHSEEDAEPVIVPEEEPK